MLPKHIQNIIVPPIKCQGIKTKLINFIANNIVWNGEGRWIEPFLGSGVVLFNIQPERAIVSDKNEHIINFYKGIQSGHINPISTREFLEYHGEKLNSIGEDYYYQIRDEFNETKNPLHFLFLSRACFNGVMRFNKAGKFNVPFCKKLTGFSLLILPKSSIKLIKYQELCRIETGYSKLVIGEKQYNKQLKTILFI